MSQDVTVVSGFLSPGEAAAVFDDLREGGGVTWYKELTTADGVAVRVPRKMAYAADAVTDYLYANLRLPGQRMTSTLTALRDRLTIAVGVPFNSVLLNLYETGRDRINWHADKEPQLGPAPTIACLNLGATRTYRFLDKATGVKTAHRVSGGDLLVMGPHCQKNKLHAILPEKDVTDARISLTFRRVYAPDEGLPEGQTDAAVRPVHGSGEQVVGAVGVEMGQPVPDEERERTDQGPDGL